uniref:Uncharacterized protein n=1 Tax=Amphiprion percula TaxID=161767 RepID=A0A3P8TZ79_AMPPE
MCDIHPLELSLHIVFHLDWFGQEHVQQAFEKLVANASKLLQDYTQVILDITFYEENKLMDQEFPGDCSAFKIQQLLEDLTEPESVLGKEPLECLYWRHGALRYMYCHTLHQRKHWIKNIYML